MQKTAWALAGALGALAVVLGAFGAHALAGRLDARAERLWALASQYLLLHAAALCALAAAAPTAGQRSTAALWALRCATAGLAGGASLFAGSLYVLALGGPRTFGAVAPLGGLAMIVGWLAVACLGFAPR